MQIGMSNFCEKINETENWTANAGSSTVEGFERTMKIICVSP